jgi:hypothetical protein
VGCGSEEPASESAARSSLPQTDLSPQEVSALEATYGSRHPGFSITISFVNGLVGETHISAKLENLDGSSSQTSFFFTRGTGIRVDPETGQFDSEGETGDGSRIRGTVYSEVVRGEFALFPHDAFFRSETRGPSDEWIPFVARRGAPGFVRPPLNGY